MKDENTQKKKEKNDFCCTTTGLVTHPSLSPLRDLWRAITLYSNLSLLLSLSGPMSVIKGDEWKTEGKKVLSPEFYAGSDHLTFSHGNHMGNMQKKKLNYAKIKNK